MIKKFFKYLFTIYCILATTYFSIMVILVILGQFVQYYNYIEFPNKSRLMYSGLFKDEFVLKDKNNKLLVNANVNDIIYNDEYVYGWNSKTYTSRYKYFIYHKRWENAELFSNSIDYYKRLEELSIDQDKNNIVNYYYLTNTDTNLKRLWFNRFQEWFQQL